LFRVLFNSRFYYPVLAVLFLDLGLSPTQYTLLNFAWAIAIVITDVPAGVLADRIGRKPLVVVATLCMVGEMILLMSAPRNGGLALFLCCLANRLLSGVAEGMASGADEALVFDSLAERNRSSEWPQVLDQVMRWQSVGMVIAMLVGGALYDPVFMNHAAAVVGLTTHWDQGVTLRFPLYLNLLTAVAALVVVLGFREPTIRESHAAPVEEGRPETCAGALELVWSAGRALPEASYGLIGAGLGALGLVVSPIARRMVTTNSLIRNYVIIVVLALMALVGVACRWHLWGVIYMIPLGAIMTLLGFMVSYYLNALVDSHQRATVLSFKGLAFNLGYGFISLLFAAVLRASRDGKSAEAALATGFDFLPLWLVLTLVLLAVGFWRHRAALSGKY
jgi:MFS family permease